MPHVAWSLPVGWTALIFVLLTRKVHRYVPEWLPPFADKLAHMTLFAILSIFTYIAFRKGSTVHMNRAAGISFVYAAVYGAATEWYQFYIPWRTGDWLDVFANVLGAAAVYALYRAERWRLQAEAAAGAPP